MRARRQGDDVVVSLSEDEAAVLVHLCEEVIVALAADPASEPRRRLLPDAYPDDADSSAEFRRFTLEELVTAKTADVHAVQEAIRTACADEGRRTRRGLSVELDSRSALAWIRGLTSARLVLGSELGVFSEARPPHEDDSRTLHDEDDRAGAQLVYEWAGYLQEVLVGLLSR